ncbi:hypothetical protein N0B31_02800 [Salinirubellus salinus]|uniref:Uncharacterized protein n=1 Tax=Salinirubellus salinus TaxID=1364945 RepID=A0A9E7R3N9_9EURY|nr:hypothetical protein [Salinirubellus salinus]UWM55220.1 hypothetical protein N0B31_02800 [Salinirubellus salinus]
MGIASSIEEDLEANGIDPADAGYQEFDDGDTWDGSNDWWSGLVETAQNPIDRATNPYDTVAGAADAAALGFDEGFGGLYSLVDDESGNTAGSGQSEMWTPTEGNVDQTVEDFQNAAEAATPGWLDWTLNNQEFVVGLLLVLAFAAATNGTVDVGGVTG